MKLPHNQHSFKVFCFGEPSVVSLFLQKIAVFKCELGSIDQNATKTGITRTNKRTMHASCRVCVKWCSLSIRNNVQSLHADSKNTTYYVRKTTTCSTATDQENNSSQGRFVPKAWQVFIFIQILQIFLCRHGNGKDYESGRSASIAARRQQPEQLQQHSGRAAHSVAGAQNSRVTHPDRPRACFIQSEYKDQICAFSLGILPRPFQDTKCG